MVLLILPFLLYSCLAISSLPSGPLIIGYPNEQECDEKVISAVKDGVNVVIWFSITLVKDKEGLPSIQGGPNYRCVGQMVQTIKQLGLPTTHLISIGGWGAPHIDTSFTAAKWWDLWKSWNNVTVAQPDLGFNGFDGIDWDFEGNNEINNPNNFFTVGVLDLMGQISQLAKADGFIVSAAPPQSYLDVGTSAFDQSVTHAPTWKTDFYYQGHNTYAPVFVKYGITTLSSGFKVPTFDFISLQLYESWSRSNYEVNDVLHNATDYLVRLVQSMAKGWEIDFASDPQIGLPTQTFKVPPTQLVIGLANGWVGPRPAKCLLIYPDEAGMAYNILKASGLAPKGFMYWDISDEGDLVNGTPFYLARGLNTYLHTRN